MEQEKSTQLEIYKAVAVKSPQIIPKFKYLWFAIILFLIVGAYSIWIQNSWAATFYQWGVYLGRIAITLLGIVVFPGILGRFKIEIPLTRIITVFRRQLGITVFLLAFTHYNFVRGALIYSGQIPLWPRQIFELMGTGALSILFLMFLTSNDTSKKALGKLWKVLHRFVYLVLWLLVLHTGLQRISIWTVLIGTVGALEVLSWIYHFLVKPKSSQTQIKK